MPNQRPAVLCTTCQHCAATKHAIQYTGENRIQKSPHAYSTLYDKPGVCLVCPRCDSPSVAADAA